MDRVKCAFPALDVKTDGVHDHPRAGDGSRYQAIIIDVGMHGFDAGNITGKQGKGYFGMPRGDPNGEIGIAQMPDNAAAEKSIPAKYSHPSRRHNPKVPRRLPLSYSPYASSNRPKQAWRDKATATSGVISVGQQSGFWSRIAARLPEARTRAFLYPGVRPPRAVLWPPTAWRRAFRRAPRCGQPACAGRSRRRHDSGEPP